MEPKPTYTVADYTTIRIYRNDVQRLDAIRRQLVVADGGNGKSQADALAYLLDGYEQAQTWIIERSKE